MYHFCSCVCVWMWWKMDFKQFDLMLIEAVGVRPSTPRLIPFSKAGRFNKTIRIITFNLGISQFLIQFGYFSDHSIEIDSIAWCNQLYSLIGWYWLDARARCSMINARLIHHSMKLLVLAQQLKFLTEISHSTKLHESKSIEITSNRWRHHRIW